MNNLERQLSNIALNLYKLSDKLSLILTTSAANLKLNNFFPFTENQISITRNGSFDPERQTQDKFVPWVC